MSTPVAEVATRDDEPIVEAPESSTAESESSAQGTDASDTQDRAVPVPLSALAAFLATAAAGWMTAGIFEGFLARLIGVLGPAVGAGMVALSHRFRSPSLVQYLILPLLVLTGALLILPDASGGSANLPGLVAEAIREGGLSQPPVTFAPGWRVILVVLTGVLATGSASMAIATNRPKLGLLLPVPFIFATALAQPASATVVSSIVALALAIGAMSVAFGADLAREGVVSGSFEVRRLGRGLVVLVGVAAMLFGLSQLGFLFPEVQEDEVVEPRRPEIPPPAPDRELFRVTSPVIVPVRLGVLDVYGLEENAWLTPPFRRSRLIEVGADGIVPLLGNDEGESATILEPPLGTDGETYEVTFSITDVPGRTIPNVANPVEVRTTGGTGIEYDPRTQSFTVTETRARAGTTYTVVVPTPPDTRQLVAAPVAGERYAEFLQAPEPPIAVEELLALAPTANLFDRLQFVRDAYYTNVIASGAGEPVDVPASRVAEMLAGGKGTPYEITAGEVLLARWAGVPSRIGYGYFGGDEVDGAENTLSVRPVHGAMWLEAYFEGHGWVPIIGTPPQAQASISDDEQREDPSIRATDELALLVYVPIKLTTVQLLFEIVRFWVYRVAPVGLAVAGALVFYPGLLKTIRRARRRRWARRHGPSHRVAVAYGELRDAANDYNFGDVQHTPLEFLGDLAVDAEHRELAWVVTRTLWGDLARDVRPEDAEAAEEMARSLLKRLHRANNGLPRAIALASRASLREPWTAEIPNLWPTRTAAEILAPARRVLTAPLRFLAAVNPVRLARRFRGAGATSLIMALFLSGCAQSIDLESVGVASFPDPVVPAKLGDYGFERAEEVEEAYDRDNALVDEGRVWTIHDGPTVQGSLQIASFKPGVRDREQALRDGVVKSIGGGRFELVRLGGERVYTLEQTEQRMFMWFPPGSSYYQLLVARREFEEADELFLDILAFQQGQGPIDPNLLIEAPDARRRLTP